MFVHVFAKCLTRAVAIAAAIAAPLSASGLTIYENLPCEVDFTDGQIYPAGAGPDTSYAAGSSKVGDGIVSWDYTSAQGNWTSVVQICQSNRALQVSFPGADGGSAEDVFYEMAFGDNAYSLSDISTTMRGLGAEPRIVPNFFGSCACDAAGY